MLERWRFITNATKRAKNVSINSRNTQLMTRKAPFDPLRGAEKGLTPTETAGQISLHPQKTTKNRKLENSNFFFIPI